ncbi:MAG: Ig-like domain-containing protein, partial [Nanoarchaeota archaeon]
ASEQANITLAKNNPICWYYWANDTSSNNATSTTYCFTVQNTAPSFNQSLTAQDAYSGVEFNYDINCSDIDGDTVTYYDNTTLFDINSTTGLINDTPIQAEAGIYSINITCGDGEINVTSSFIYTIADIIPTVTLVSPNDGYVNDSTALTNISFNCSAVDDSNLKNISLYLTDAGNNSASFALNQTANITGTANSSSWTLELPVGNYTWNCLVYDNDSNSDWGTNRSIVLNFTDSTAPSLSNIVPGRNAVDVVVTTDITFDVIDLYSINSSSLIVYVNGINFTQNLTITTNSVTNISVDLNESLFGFTNGQTVMVLVNISDNSSNLLQDNFTFTTIVAAVPTAPSSGGGGGGGIARCVSGYEKINGTCVKKEEAVKEEIIKEKPEEPIKKGKTITEEIVKEFEEIPTVIKEEFDKAKEELPVGGAIQRTGLYLKAFLRSTQRLITNFAVYFIGLMIIILLLIATYKIRTGPVEHYLRIHQPAPDVIIKGYGVDLPVILQPKEEQEKYLGMWSKKQYLDLKGELEQVNRGIKGFFLPTRTKPPLPQREEASKSPEKTSTSIKTVTEKLEKSLLKIKSPEELELWIYNMLMLRTSGQRAKTIVKKLTNFKEKEIVTALAKAKARMVLEKTYQINEKELSELRRFVLKNIKKGVDKKETISDLVREGWSKEAVEGFVIAYYR